VGTFIPGCSSVPPQVENTASVQLAQPQSTPLGRSAARLSEKHPNLSGHVVLDTGRQAFSARIALAGSAQRTLDAQYYIWNDDRTGRILAQQVIEAAERGVRVRLLLDDYGTGGKDKQLAILDAHEQVEVRVYNPFNAGFRSGLRRWANLTLGFSRLNRRMHSKTFIVDNALVITGGRNIGDEYFDANPSVNHRDRDMLSMGPVVQDISKQFDVMWNSEWSIPISELSNAGVPIDEQHKHYRELSEVTAVDRQMLYPLPLTSIDRDQLLQSFLDTAIWGPTSFVYNPPAITRGDEAGGAAVTEKLMQLLSEATSEVLVESAYFTVMDDMLDRLAPYLDSKLKIRVLTNSLATTDVWTIHAGYTRNREELLQRGVELYEWRGDGQSCRTIIDNEQLNCAEFLYSLHAKSVVFDRDTIFVGSFNLNPRSHLLNTETALVIKSTVLAERISADISLNMHGENSWRLAFGSSGDLQWHGSSNGKAEILNHEPRTSTWARFKAAVASKLPLEKYW
jgi:putative cardiolipin synthase